MEQLLLKFLERVTGTSASILLLIAFVIFNSRAHATSFFDPSDVHWHTEDDLRVIAVELEAHHSELGMFPQPTTAGSLPAQWVESRKELRGHKLFDQGKQYKWRKNFHREKTLLFLAIGILALPLFIIVRAAKKDEPSEWGRVSWKVVASFLAGVLIFCVMGGPMQSPPYSFYDNPDYGEDELDYYYETDGSTWFLLQGVGSDGVRSFDPSFVPEQPGYVYPSRDFVRSGDSNAPDWMNAYHVDKVWVEPVDADIMLLWVSEDFPGFGR